MHMEINVGIQHVSSEMNTCYCYDKITHEEKPPHRDLSSHSLDLMQMFKGFACR